MAKQAEIASIHDELESVNREREAFEAEKRAKALDLATKRNLLYREATAKRDAIAQTGYANVTLEDGRVVQREVRVYDPALLDRETLAILEHMGTPVPPIDEVYPDGVTMGKQG